MEKKKLCFWVGAKPYKTSIPSQRCNRVALVRIIFLSDNKEGEYYICDRHLEFYYWFYDKSIWHNFNLRKGILVIPIWKDEEEYKNALVEEMIEHE